MSSFIQILDNVLFNASAIVIPLEAKEKVTFLYSVIFLEFLILKRKPRIILRLRPRQRSTQNKRKKRRKTPKLWVLRVWDCYHILSGWRVKRDQEPSHVMCGFRNRETVFHVEYFLFLSCFLVLIWISFTVNCSEMYSYPCDSRKSLLYLFLTDFLSRISK